MQIKFFAFDTETISRAGHGEAVLLGINSEKGFQFLEKPKTFDAIFNFLAGRDYAAFNADFDITAILHTHFIKDEKGLEDLICFGRNKIGKYFFKYIPQKYLFVSDSKTHFTIYDIRAFFQGESLASATEKYLGENLKQEIPIFWYSEIDKCLKDNRREKILKYLERDIFACQKLIDLTCETFSACNIKVKNLISPASLAMCIFGKQILENQISPQANKVFEKSYFGGRIEISEIGNIGEVFNYDIKSAYPSICADLSECRNLFFSEGVNKSAKFGSYLIDCEISPQLKFAPFPVRDGKTIIFPTGRFQTWVGKKGLEIANRYDFKYKILKAYELRGGDEKKVFPQIPKLFEMRKDPQKKLAIKLMLNSLYGKLCERSSKYILSEYLIGGRDLGGRILKNITTGGKYINFAYASAITEAIRLRVWEYAYNYDGVAIMTDGVLTRKKITEGIGEKLGDLEFKGKFNAILAGNGRYFLENSDPQKNEYHFRGLGNPKGVWEKIKNTKSPFLECKSLERLTLKKWVRDLHRENLNVLQNFKKIVKLDDVKRQWGDLSNFNLCDLFTKKIKGALWIILSSKKKK